MSGVDVGQYDSSEVERRSVSDSDLKIILLRATNDGGFSPLDFTNCNDADLDRLGQLAQEKMDEIPSSDLAESRKRTLLLIAVTDERVRRSQKMAAQIVEQAGALRGQIDELGLEFAELSQRLDAGSRELHGIIVDAGNGISEADAAIESVRATRERVDAILAGASVFQAEGRPVQGDVS